MTCSCNPGCFGIILLVAAACGGGDACGVAALICFVLAVMEMNRYKRAVSARMQEMTHNASDGFYERDES
jgi:hypothetical protein